jgi:glycosyltransferase involved in cell wall biosynthesis
MVEITAVILTFNEAANIARTLSNLDWLARIVVVDSFSADATAELVRSNPKARLFTRKFTTHAEQWNYALTETGIDTEWVLALDADYQATPAFAQEVANIADSADVSGYRAGFRYCINGRELRGTLYPPVTVLFRRKGARYIQDGHTQRIQVEGPVRDLKNPLLHDDRKPMSSWIQSQNRYMRLEAEKLLSTASAELRWPDRIRRMRVVAPFAVLVHCLIFKGLILDGRAGLFYTVQRVFAEMMLSVYLLSHDLGLEPNAGS